MGIPPKGLAMDYNNNSSNDQGTISVFESTFIRAFEKSAIHLLLSSEEFGAFTSFNYHELLHWVEQYIDWEFCFKLSKNLLLNAPRMSIQTFNHHLRHIDAHTLKTIFLNDYLTQRRIAWSSRKPLLVRMDMYLTLFFQTKQHFFILMRGAARFSS